MARRQMTVARFEEIRRLIIEGLSDRAIARALQCRRAKVAEIRSGGAVHPATPKEIELPLWANQVDWEEVKRELGYKHPLKFVWEEKASGLTTYSNFWKQFHRQFPELRQASVVARDFAAGERAEVDWAGGTVRWWDRRQKKFHKATVFVGTLGYSQLIYACAKENMRGPSFLQSHRQMYEFFGGVPKITAPDCTKTAVLKCHLYDPDLNPSYVEMASHYNTEIVPARPKRPKDKALVECAVKLVMRYYRWRYRKHVFCSLAEINRALAQVCYRLNSKPHSRFKVSRLERWEVEKAALKPLPSMPFENVEWKQPTVHPDCYVAIESNYYSAPHIYRGKKLRARLSENVVELFYDSERIAVHPRNRSKKGERVRKLEHFPDNAKAYYEATPQNLRSQARFIQPALYDLVNELFAKDTCGHIRIVQGLLRVATKEINEVGKSVTEPRIKKAVETMQTYSKVRVSYFRNLLILYRKQAFIQNQNREIQRRPGNPMLRHTGPVKPKENNNGNNPIQ